MDDDVKELAEQYKQRVEDERVKGKASRDERRLIRDQGPELWSNLCSILKRKRDFYNEEIGEEVLSWEQMDSNHFSISRKSDSAWLKGEFFEDSGLANFESLRANISLSLELSFRDGQLEFVSIDRKTKVMSVNKSEDIARGLMRDFVKI